MSPPPSKSPPFDDHGISDAKEEVGDSQGGIEEPKDISSNQGCSSTPLAHPNGHDPPPNVVDEGPPLEDCRYPTRERRPLGEWWKNHILPQHNEEHANVACLDGPLNLCEAMRSEDASK